MPSNSSGLVVDCVGTGLSWRNRINLFHNSTLQDLQGRFRLAGALGRGEPMLILAGGPGTEIH